MRTIDLVFENCEVYRGFEGNDITIKYGYLKKLESYPSDSENLTRAYVDKIEIIVKPHMHELMERIMLYHDITAVCIMDGKDEIHITVPWNDEHRESNAYQKENYLIDESLKVTIMEEEKVIYCCPFCKKNYEDVNDFANCVTSCKKKADEAKKTVDDEKRNEALRGVVAAYNKYVSLQNDYITKYGKNPALRASNDAFGFLFRV